MSQDLYFSVPCDVGLINQDAFEKGIFYIKFGDPSFKHLQSIAGIEDDAAYLISSSQVHT